MNEWIFPYNLEQIQFSEYKMCVSQLVYHERNFAVPIKILFSESLPMDYTSKVNLRQIHSFIQLQLSKVGSKL